MKADATQITIKVLTIIICKYLDAANNLSFWD